MDVEARYQCRMQHDWSRRAGLSGRPQVAIRLSSCTVGVTSSDLWASTAFESRRATQDCQSTPIAHAGETRAVEELPWGEAARVRLFLADDTFRAGRREK